MNETIKKALAGIYENLTDEQKEKAKKCKTMDEMMALAGEWGIELPDEMLDAVTGGSEPVAVEKPAAAKKPAIKRKEVVDRH